MRKLLVLITIIFGLLLISCGGETIFEGMAYRLKAEAGLKEIRNALAKYEIKEGQYPAQDEWEKVLEPYFRKEIHPDPEWVIRRKKFVMRSKTKIDQCEGIVKEIKKDLFYADSSLSARVTRYLFPIDSALTYASYEINEARAYNYREIVPELDGLSDFITNLNVQEEKNMVINSMRQQKEEINYFMTSVESSLLQRDSLRKSDLIKEEVVESLFNHIERKLDIPLLEIEGQPVPVSSDKADTIPLYSNEIQDQIDRIKNTLDLEKDSTLISQLNEFDNMMLSYINGSQTIRFIETLIEVNKKIPVAEELFSSFFSERDNVLSANKVLNGYSSLESVVSMVTIYEDENDSLPKGNLYEVFKEQEAMKELRNDLASDPYIEVLDNGYKLISEALDEDRTKLVMEISFVNNYKKLVKESFSEGPFYETNDDYSAYYLWVKAKDAENTIISTRSKFKAKED